MTEMQDDPIMIFVVNEKGQKLQITHLVNVSFLFASKSTLQVFANTQLTAMSTKHFSLRDSMRLQQSSV